MFCLIPLAREGDPSVDNLVELLDHNHLENKNYFESGEKALREVRTGMEQVFESEELAVLTDRESQQLFMHVSTPSSSNSPPFNHFFPTTLVPAFAYASISSFLESTSTASKRGFRVSCHRTKEGFTGGNGNGHCGNAFCPLVG